MTAPPAQPPPAGRSTAQNGKTSPDASVILPPFRRLLGSFPGLTVTGPYNEPFEPLISRLVADVRWDLPTFEAIARDRAGTVLDIGCGRGRVSLALARAGLDVTAVDTSRPALRRLALGAHAEGLSHRIRAVHADILDPTPGPRGGPGLGTGHTTAVIGDMSINIFAEPGTVRGLLTSVRRRLAPTGVFCLPVLTDAALSCYRDRNGLTVTTATDDEGRHHLLFGVTRFADAPRGPHVDRPLPPVFTRTFFVQRMDGRGELQACLAGARERLWTETALTPHLTAAGFRVAERTTVVARDDAFGRVDVDILVLHVAG